MVPAYEERSGKGHSEYQSQTEKYGILRAFKELRLQCLERALAALTKDERELVEEKYFNPFASVNARTAPALTFGHPG